MCAMNTLALSVVIASGAGGEFLFRCLESLDEQAKRLDAELIVVDRCGEATRRRIRQHHPSVRVRAHSGQERPSVPQLRAAGVDAAQGDIVAIIEEHCVAPSDWIDTILDEFGPDDAAIGGPILDDDFRRLRDWEDPARPSAPPLTADVGGARPLCLDAGLDESAWIGRAHGPGQAEAGGGQGRRQPDCRVHQ